MLTNRLPKYWYLDQSSIRAVIMLCVEVYLVLNMNNNCHRIGILLFDGVDDELSEGDYV